MGVEAERQGRLVAWIARAHLVRLRRVRQEHWRGSRPRVGAGETGGVPLKGYKARREDARPRVERVRGVVHRQPARARLVVVDDGRLAADASPEPGPDRA